MAQKELEWEEKSEVPSAVVEKPDWETRLLHLTANQDKCNGVEGLWCKTQM